MELTFAELSHICIDAAKEDGNIVDVKYKTKQTFSRIIDAINYMRDNVGSKAQKLFRNWPEDKNLSVYLGQRHFETYGEKAGFLNHGDSVKIISRNGSLVEVVNSKGRWCGFINKSFVESVH